VDVTWEAIDTRLDIHTLAPQVFQDGITRERADPFSAVQALPLNQPISLRETCTIQVVVFPGYEVRITDIVITNQAGRPYLMDLVKVEAHNVGWNIATLEIPIDYYVDSVGDISLLITVHWQLEGHVGRHLRALAETSGESGNAETQLDVKLAPLEDSGSYNAKVAALTVLTTGAAVLLL